MKFFLFAALLLGSLSASAADIECSHKKGVIKCTFAKETLVIGAVINGGECPVPAIHKTVPAGGAFVIPGSRECYYNRMLWLYTGDGKVHRFYAM